jgi:hypothetical protein
MLAVRWMRIAGAVGLAVAGAIFAWMAMVIWDLWPLRSTIGFDPSDLAGYLIPYGLLTVFCLIGVGADRQYWRWIGVVAAAVAYVMVCYAQIKQLHGDPTLLISITTLAAVIAQANMLSLIPLRPNQVWLRWVTILAGVATGACTCMTTYIRYGGGWSGGAEDLLVERMAGAFGVIAGCGTLALAVLARINRRWQQAASTPISDLREITLVCPLCQKKQTIPLNADARCGGCNVQLNVRVEEPRCHVCGYSLMMLTSVVCPECGSPVSNSPSASAATASAAGTPGTFPPPPVQTAHTS